MFWNTILKPNQNITFKTNNILHITNASLVSKTKTELKQRTQLFITSGKHKVLIASFIPGICEQVRLDLVVGEEIIFSNTGLHYIHLSGFTTELSKPQLESPEDDDLPELDIVPQVDSENNNEELTHKKPLKKPKEVKKEDKKLKKETKK
ncbi:hypothetical protein CL6EHI_169990 [Entamoeba histolytica]|uniref:Nucleoplasmin-like domain-containing protein n=1 Tax=Entamoeba histolytica TaxID=5759 RepID=A0A175JMX5_ENTHI|nr:hypothetical protein CL6EHI_169990 [Entamoeba histolytica]